MPAPITLRLDGKTRHRVQRVAHRKQVSASEAIRNAIHLWLEREEAADTPYERAADLVGVVRGKNPRRSEGTGRRFKELLNKRRHR